MAGIFACLLRLRTLYVVQQAYVPATDVTTRRPAAIWCRLLSHRGCPDWTAAQPACRCEAQQAVQTRRLAITHREMTSCRLCRSLWSGPRQRGAWQARRPDPATPLARLARLQSRRGAVAALAQWALCRRSCLWSMLSGYAWSALSPLAHGANQHTPCLRVMHIFMNFYNMAVWHVVMAPCCSNGARHTHWSGGAGCTNAANLKQGLQSPAVGRQRAAEAYKELILQTLLGEAVSPGETLPADVRCKLQQSCEVQANSVGQAAAVLRRWHASLHRCSILIEHGSSSSSRSGCYYNTRWCAVTGDRESSCSESASQAGECRSKARSSEQELARLRCDILNTSGGGAQDAVASTVRRTDWNVAAQLALNIERGVVRSGAISQPRHVYNARGYLYASLSALSNRCSYQQRRGSRARRCPATCEFRPVRHFACEIPAAHDVPGSRRPAVAGSPVTWSRHV